MDRKLQDHTQEIERLEQQSSIEKERLLHEAKLKKKAAEVSVCSWHLLYISNGFNDDSLSYV